MNPPFIAADKPPQPFVSEIYDDSPIESEILLALIEKTLQESDVVVEAMSSCIAEMYSALKAPLFGESTVKIETHLSSSIFSEYMDSEMEIDFTLSESMVSETEIDISLSDSMVSETKIDITLSDSMVGEMDFEIPLSESMVLETEFEQATEARGGGDGRISKVEPESQKAVKVEMECDNAPKSLSPSAEIMMRILLPAYFDLVRSFPILLLVRCFL